ncbi:MAG TPA: AMP-binding protein, partial [Verrucomicrobiae bacterium]|nr:AMP-binding protein [Verrucomicrobiae bacterium]
KFADRLAGLFKSRLNRECLSPPATRPEDPALILFTSGSEGEPKGVELSHRNVLANVRQMLAVVDLVDTDRFFNALPLFHSFGLTVGLLLPLIQGNFVFLYVSPLHYRVVPVALYHTNATVFFGTNTFLAAYARKAHPYDFHSVRYVFAGAEKLLDGTRQLWMQKFGLRIFEGYGATECSPGVAVNTPMDSRTGSVGKFLPGIEYRLEPVEGIPSMDSAKMPDEELAESAQLTRNHRATTGKLLVRGPNIMMGYIRPGSKGGPELVDGWYDTGDVARVDADGYVYLLGRLRRFAKISGEMVSLTAIEEALSGAFPHFSPKLALAVVARPDESRGETILLVTNEPELKLPDVRQAILAQGLTNLAVPREIHVMRDLPLLGSGKVDQRELEKRLRATGQSNGFQ